MINEDLGKRWNDCRDGQILVDASHPLKLLLGLSADGNKQLLVPVQEYVSTLKSSASIKVTNGVAGEQKYIIIELINSSLTNEFIYLCIDLIEKSRFQSTPYKSVKALLDSFCKWQQLFDVAKKDLLSGYEIKGLIGEILFINQKIKSGVNANSVIDAWQTHKDAARDFIFDDIWYEIKAVASTSDHVTISSIEQLDHESMGKLAIYFLDKKNNGDDLINLPMIIKQTKELINDSSVVAQFTRKLLSKGYTYHQEYENEYFDFIKSNFYKVSDSFPVIRKENIPEQILNAKYDISIKAIHSWLEV